MRMSDWSSDVCSSDLAHFAGLDRLLEVSQRDVAPDVAAPVDADGVDAPLHVAYLGHAVVRLDLGGVGFEVQVQRLHEAPRQRVPVHGLFVRHAVVVVASAPFVLSTAPPRPPPLPPPLLPPP